MTATTNDRPATASANSKGAGRDSGANEPGGRLAAVREGYETARERTAAAYAAARERAGTVYETAGRRAGEGIDANPVAAVVGGLALGAILAALLPKTSKEEELLGPVGRKINDGARDAARAARESGVQQLEELGLTRDGIKRRLDEFSDRAAGAVRSGGKGREGNG